LFQVRKEINNKSINEDLSQLVNACSRVWFMKCPKQAGARCIWNQLLLPSQVNRTWNEGVEGTSFVHFGREGNMWLVLTPLNTNQYGLEMHTLHPYLLHTSCLSTTSTSPCPSLVQTQTRAK